MPAPPAKAKPLPIEVAIALSDGRRIEATQLLRAAEGCDLNTAYGRINEAILNSGWHHLLVFSQGVTT